MNRDEKGKGNITVKTPAFMDTANNYTIID